jgi:Flp pilus assembly pilin Flp
MKVFRQRIRNFVTESSGATAVEYAVLLALIAGAIIVAVTATGDSASSFWDGNADTLENAIR